MNIKTLNRKLRQELAKRKKAEGEMPKVITCSELPENPEPHYYYICLSE